MNTHAPRRTPSRTSSSHKKHRPERAHKHTNARSARRPHGGSGQGGRRGGRKMPTFDPSHFINNTPAPVVQEAPYEPKHTFATFGLDERLARNIASMDITVPTPIQDQIIPQVLAGRDVIGLAETGTGKTAAFLVPLVHHTLSAPQSQTLILAPTRELALQIEAELRKLAHGLKLSSVTCVGGMNINPQLRALRRHNQFIIGTPGRVLDLINRNALPIECTSAVVLDEADRMLDMGFVGDMRAILSKTPAERRTLLFSATIVPETRKLVHDFLTDPVEVSVKKRETAASIKQDVVPYNPSAKFETLSLLLSKPEFSRVIIFGAMKHSVKRLALDLSDLGVAADSLHGNKTHVQRQRALDRFKKGNVRVLVCTDVAARGIHVDDVSHVINYDLPTTREDYVHRIGRTGRGTKRGEALTFVPAK